MKKIKSIVPIGLWVHKDQVEAVWLEKPQWARNKTTINPPPEPHFATIPLMPQVTLANRIIREMTINLKPHKTDLLFISGVLPNNVWERSLIIPQKLCNNSAVVRHSSRQFLHRQALALPFA